ncbi:hypothetical protein GCM10009759_73800 [Kitasatospora saccharophila]|uniref:Uncharacterized protein n=1 Tax=Kitasatospora saccharophila TaxID=407973 RepID=A0ABN2YAT0_9ACTN
MPIAYSAVLIPASGGPDAAFRQRYRSQPPNLRTARSTVAGRAARTDFVVFVMGGDPFVGNGLERIRTDRTDPDGLGRNRSCTPPPRPFERAPRTGWGRLRLTGAGRRRWSAP